MKVNFDNFRNQIVTYFNVVAESAAKNWDNLNESEREAWQDLGQHIALLLLFYDPMAENFSELDTDTVFQFPDND